MSLAFFFICAVRIWLMRACLLFFAAVAVAAANTVDAVRYCRRRRSRMLLVRKYLIIESARGKEEIHI